MASYGTTDHLSSRRRRYFQSPTAIADYCYDNLFTGCCAHRRLNMQMRRTCHCLFVTSRGGTVHTISHCLLGFTRCIALSQHRKFLIRKKEIRSGRWCEDLVGLSVQSVGLLYGGFNGCLEIFCKENKLHYNVSDVQKRHSVIFRN